MLHEEKNLPNCRYWAWFDEGKGIFLIIISHIYFIKIDASERFLKRNKIKKADFGKSGFFFANKRRPLGKVNKRHLECKDALTDTDALICMDKRTDTH